MWLVRLALRRPYTIAVLCSLSAIFGVLCASRMKTDILPAIDIPVVIVVWNYPGLSAEDMERRVVRYGDLKPCRTAFIDAHTPGSDRKENFTIIGAGVSESPEQHVHIRETPGFNVGAAGQPPRCRNSLHAHRTAEVFFVQEGRWRFFWGRDGTAGEVVLEKGDIFDIPTGIFRGFENVGTDYGMIMSILGGDDAGGVIWAASSAMFST